MSQTDEEDLGCMHLIYPAESCTICNPFRVTISETPMKGTITMSVPDNTPNMNPIMRYFEYTHLPEYLREVSKPFCQLADHLDATLPNGPEKSTALRKLLESKDAAVRAALD